QVLNVGSQEPEVTMGELAGIVLRALGKDLPIAPLPSTPGSPPRRCPDMAKTHQLTGVAAQVGLEQGVAQTLDWYERHVFAN
ncbi:MAG: NAD-binding protein, partial [Desulfovibrio sp.]